MNQPRVAVLTGGTGVIGAAIARSLVSQGFSLWLVARDHARAEHCVGLLGAKPGQVTIELADVGCQRTVVRLASRLPASIDVLINNAAECPRQRRETPEGIERQFATNVLGYHWMIEHLAPALASADQARVVNVASYWAGDLELDDVEFRRRRYDNNTAYRQAKQANRMLTVGHARRLATRGIHVYACHPGDVRSKLSQDLGFGGHETPDQAAATPLWLVSTPKPEPSGCYFSHCRRASCDFGRDLGAVARLMTLCDGYANRGVE